MTKPASAPPADVLRQMVAEMVNFADVADRCELTEGNAPVAIRAWAERLAASAQVREVEANCRGSWQLGNNCKRCPRCLSTMPAAEPVPVAQEVEPIREFIDANWGATTNYDLFVTNARSALGKYYDADAGLICSIALLTAEHYVLRKKAEATEASLAALVKVCENVECELPATPKDMQLALEEAKKWLP